MTKNKSCFFWFFFICVFLPNWMNAQSLPNTSSLDDFDRLDFAIFITMVKENHPLAKRAEILKKLGEATVLQSRGNFDPILEGEKQIVEKNLGSLPYLHFRIVCTKSHVISV